jgi:hypothetical protein
MPSANNTGHSRIATMYYEKFIAWWQDALLLNGKSLKGHHIEAVTG